MIKFDKTVMYPLDINMAKWKKENGTQNMWNRDHEDFLKGLHQFYLKPSETVPKSHTLYKKYYISNLGIKETAKLAHETADYLN